MISGERIYNFIYVGPDSNVSLGSHKRLTFQCSCGKIKDLVVRQIVSNQTKTCGECNHINLNPGDSYFSFIYTGDSIRIGSGSYRKLLFQCKCGIKKNISLRSVTMGQMTCGDCNKIALSSGDEYYGFIYADVPILIGPHSNKKLLFTCKCGKTRPIQIGCITRGETSTCGRCNHIQLIPDQTVKNFIYRGPPILAAPGSIRKLLFECRCGKPKRIALAYILNGETTKCGECNAISLSNGCSYGEFIYEGSPLVINAHSHNKIPFRCRCGKTKYIPMDAVTSGRSVTCNECNHIYLRNGDFYCGFIYLGDPIYVGKNSNNKFDFKCRCGKMMKISLNHVTSGSTSSCGNCLQSVHDWYVKVKHILLSLSLPITPSSIPLGGIRLLETVYSMWTPVKASCVVCNSEHRPRFGDIIRGKSLTCGCCSYRISLPNREIASFICSLGMDPDLEFEVGGLKYDIAVTNRKLLLELNGIKWHSNPKSRNRDYLKYETAKLNGFSFLSVFEDEWRQKRNVIENIIRNRLGIFPIRKFFRPKDVVVQSVTSQKADDLYDEFHYIGGCNSKLNYGVFVEDVLIGAASFRRPSRQNIKQSFEISRMVMNPCYMVHGIWSHILHRFIKEFTPTSIVSFSDNRLFSGEVYKKMGFTCDGIVPPDYFWTKNNRRFHKSSLRKPPGYYKTETHLRESEGYQKIWDLGKIRWVWIPNL